MRRGTLGFRTAIGALVAIVLGSAALAFAPPASAVAGFQFTRFAGPNRYQTACDIARATFPTGAQTVIIARGEQNLNSFPDALAGNGLAGDIEAPILLTDPNILPSETNTCLTQLGATRVILLGQTTAISTTVENGLRTRFGSTNVERIGGADRFQTAALIARRVGGTGGTGIGTDDGRRTAIVATGRNFPDALAGGPVSFDQEWPILLSERNTLTTPSRDVIRDFQIRNVIILGQTDAVSTEVEQEIKAIDQQITIARIGGGDRHETARLIAEFALIELGFSAAHVNLARSDDFPDALAGGPHGGRERAPIILTPPTQIHEAACQYLQDHSNTLTAGHIYGGQLAITQATEDQAERCAAGLEAGTNQTFGVTQGQQFVNTGETRECRVGAAPGTVLDLQLFARELVNVSENDFVTFTDANGDNLADRGTTPAVITSVNGVTTTPTVGSSQSNNLVVGSTGVITFTITSNQPDAVIAVAFADAVATTTAGSTANDQLNLNNEDQATEAFGVGCDTVFQQGPSPVINDARVIDTAGVADTFTVGTDFTLTFSEPLADTADDLGQQIRATDADGTIVDFVCAVGPAADVDKVGVTCVLSQGNTVLTVTLNEDPNGQNVADGTNGILNIPATIQTLTLGFADLQGNPVNIVNSPDRVLDVE